MNFLEVQQNNMLSASTSPSRRELFKNKNLRQTMGEIGESTFNIPKKQDTIVEPQTLQLLSPGKKGRGLNMKRKNSSQASILSAKSLRQHQRQSHMTKLMEDASPRKKPTELKETFSYKNIKLGEYLGDLKKPSPFFKGMETIDFGHESLNTWNQLKNNIFNDSEQVNWHKNDKKHIEKVNKVKSKSNFSFVGMLSQLNFKRQESFVQKTPAGKKKKAQHNAQERTQSGNLVDKLVGKLGSSRTILKPQTTLISPQKTGDKMINIGAPGLLSKRNSGVDSLTSSEHEVHEEYFEGEEEEKISLLERRKMELLRQSPKNPVKKANMTSTPGRMERRQTIKQLFSSETRHNAMTMKIDEFTKKGEAYQYTADDFLRFQTRRKSCTCNFCGGELTRKELLYKSYATENELAIMREIEYVENKKRQMKQFLSQTLIEMFRKARLDREAKAAIKKGLIKPRQIDYKKQLIQNQLKGLQKGSTLRKFSLVKTKGLKSGVKEDKKDVRKMDQMPTLTISHMDDIKEESLDQTPLKRQESTVKQRLQGLSIFSNARKSKRDNGIDLEKLKKEQENQLQTKMSSVIESESYQTTSSESLVTSKSSSSSQSKTSLKISQECLSPTNRGGSLNKKEGQNRRSSIAKARRDSIKKLEAIGQKRRDSISKLRRDSATKVERRGSILKHEKLQVPQIKEPVRRQNSKRIGDLEIPVAKLKDEEGKQIDLLMMVLNKNQVQDLRRQSQATGKGPSLFKQRLSNAMQRHAQRQSVVSQSKQDSDQLSQLQNSESKPLPGNKLFKFVIPKKTAEKYQNLNSVMQKTKDSQSSSNLNSSKQEIRNSRLINSDLNHDLLISGKLPRSTSMMQDQFLIHMRQKDSEENQGHISDRRTSMLYIGKSKSGQISVRRESTETLIQKSQQNSAQKHEAKDEKEEKEDKGKKKEKIFRNPYTAKVLQEKKKLLPFQLEKKFQKQRFMPHFSIEQALKSSQILKGELGKQALKQHDELLKEAKETINKKSAKPMPALKLDLFRRGSNAARHARSQSLLERPKKEDKVAKTSLFPTAVHRVSASMLNGSQLQRRLDQMRSHTALSQTRLPLSPTQSLLPTPKTSFVFQQYQPSALSRVVSTPSWQPESERQKQLRLFGGQSKKRQFLEAP